MFSSFTVFRLQNTFSTGAASPIDCWKVSKKPIIIETWTTLVSGNKSFRCAQCPQHNCYFTFNRWGNNWQYLAIFSNIGNIWQYLAIFSNICNNWQYLAIFSHICNNWQYWAQLIIFPLCSQELIAKCGWLWCHHVPPTDLEHDGRCPLCQVKNMKNYVTNLSRSLNKNLDLVPWIGE